jgi:hypothetical protein
MICFPVVTSRNNATDNLTASHSSHIMHSFNLHIELCAACGLKYGNLSRTALLASDRYLSRLVFFFCRNSQASTLL